VLAGAPADAPLIADVGKPPRFDNAGCAAAEFIRAAGIPAVGADAGLAITAVDRAGIGVVASLAAGAGFAARAGGGTFLGGVVVVVVAVCAAPAKQTVRATVPTMKAN